MTKADIIRTLHVKDDRVTIAIRELAEKYPSIKKKFVNGKLWMGTEFNLEEAKLIYKKLGRNELEILLIEENWREVPETDVFTIKGTNKFLAEKNCKEKKCCNNCKFLKGKTTKVIPRPYCDVYKKLLDATTIKISETKSRFVNIYEDYCSSYVYAELEQPRRWYKQFAPMNLNQFGKTDFVNGIERKRLDKQRKKNEPITIVTQLGFD